METLTTTTYKNHATLPEIARMIAEAFPELDGRAMAVTGIDVDEDQQKSISLPYALVGLRQSAPDGNAILGLKSKISLSDDVVIEFSFKAVKYRKSDKSETALWAYYDFESIRDRLFEKLQDEAEIRGITFQFITMDVSSDQNAVYIEFRFRQSYEWCDSSRNEAEPVNISFTLGSC